MNEKIISADILNKYQLPDVEEVNRLLTEEAESSCLKIVVLDDDRQVYRQYMMCLFIQTGV